MSKKSVALLRGINVGTAKRVAMAELRALLEQLGCSGVTTLLNSGNIVFTPSVKMKAPRTAAALIEKAIEAHLGISCRVVVITGQQLQSIVDENPHAEVAAANASRFLVAFVSDPAALTALVPLAGKNWQADLLAVGSQAAYLACPGGILKSKLGVAVNRLLGQGVTTRNWTTVRKLLAMTAD